MSTGGEGWHADPSGRFQQRYYDGQRWTEHVANHGHTGVDPAMAATFVATAPTPTAHRGGSIAAALGAVVVLAAAFMPWARLGFLTTTGVDGGDGWITLFLGIVGGSLALAAVTDSTPNVLIGTIIAGVLAGVVGLIDIADVRSHEMADVGIGLWATLAGAVAMTAGALVGMAKASVNRPAS